MQLASRRGRKTPFVRFCRAVAAANSLDEFLPPQGAENFRTTRTLRRDAKLKTPVIDVSKEVCEAECQTVISVPSEAVADFKFATPATVPNALTWPQLFARIVDSIGKPPEAIAMYVTPVALQRLQTLVFVMFVLRPFTVGRLLWSKANGFIDFVAEVDSPPPQPQVASSGSNDNMLMILCTGLVVVMLALFNPAAPAAAPPVPGAQCIIL
jgi:hypothetical protein